tara:strand:+ start:7209 stop:7949 length:741 start_codon:yes stop_codon:yes gene_type:complete
MRLAFNTDGNLLKDGDNLEDVSKIEGELYRFGMFFDTPKGEYPFDVHFGNNAPSLVGKSNVTPEELDLFIDSLKNYMISSGILTEYSVEGEFMGVHTIRFSLRSNTQTIVWDFSTKNGRLVRVDKETPVTDASFIVTSEIFKSTGSRTYDVKWIFDRCRENNKISDLETNVEFIHRLFVLDGTDEMGDLVTRYTINEFDKELILNFTIYPDKYLKFEVWPKQGATLETTTNPYLIRASWKEPTGEI